MNDQATALRMAAALPTDVLAAWLERPLQPDDAHAILSELIRRTFPSSAEI